MRIPVLFLCLLASSAMYADASTAYTLSGTNIYSVNLTNGSVSPLTSIPGATSLNGIALENNTTAYVVNFPTNNLYLVNLTNGASSTVAHVSAGTGLSDVALADNTTAYTCDFNSSKIDRINLMNGSVSTIATTPSGPNGITLSMSLTTPMYAYVATNSTGRIFRIDLTNDTSTIVASIPGAFLRDIALLNNETVFTVDNASNRVFEINLTNGNVSLAATIPGATSLNGIALASNTTAYVLDNTSQSIYFVDLTNGSSSAVASTPAMIFASIALVLQISTFGLSGNNLRFADYLNANAPQTTMPLLALQSDIPGALEIAIPTRNAIFTFAAQTTQLAFGQQIYDHLAQKRNRKAWQRQPMQTSQPMTAQAHLNRHRLFVDASDSTNPCSENITESPPSENVSESPPSEHIPESPSSENFPEARAPNSSEGNVTEKIWMNEAYYSPWLGVFGEYAHERSQKQTPSFETGTGGFVLATDYHRDIHLAPLIGGGMAYAHTHIHEADSAGHANINQGALVLYSAWNEPEWYVNWALWGGYYHAHNVRNIDLPGIPSGSAASSTHGWQLTPHFEIGYDYEDNWFCVEPFDMIDWVACWENGFEEHGAGMLDMGQKDRFCSLLRNELGVRFVETLVYDWGAVAFREKGSYVYQKAFQTGVITAFLVGSAGSFIVSTLTGAQNLGAVEFETLFTPSNKKYPYGTISYQGEFGSRYQSHQGMITIGMDF